MIRVYFNLSSDESAYPSHPGHHWLVQHHLQRDHQRRWLVLCCGWLTSVCVGGALWRMRRYLETMLWLRLVAMTPSCPNFLWGLTVFRLMSGRLMSLLFGWPWSCGEGVALMGDSCDAVSCKSSFASPWSATLCSSQSPSFSGDPACHCDTTTRSRGRGRSTGVGTKQLQTPSSVSLWQYSIEGREPCQGRVFESNLLSCKKL